MATVLISTVGVDGSVDCGVSIDEGSAKLWALEDYASGIATRVGLFNANESDWSTFALTERKAVVVIGVKSGIRIGLENCICVKFIVSVIKFVRITMSWLASLLPAVPTTGVARGLGL